MTAVAESHDGVGCRGEQGLTTLEWLLITAAVAGLAALAVVLVQAHVEDTGDRIANPDPRVTSAIHSAFEVERDAKAASVGDFSLWADWEDRYGQRCSLIAVLYSDAEVEVVQNNFNGVIGGGAFDPVIAAAADDQVATAIKAQVQCVWAELSPAGATTGTGLSLGPRAGGCLPDARNPQDRRRGDGRCRRFFDS